MNYYLYKWKIHILNYFKINIITKFWNQLFSINIFEKLLRNIILYIKFRDINHLKNWFLFIKFKEIKET